jgi:beta-carotene/zeaxanthin 4-ketolase
MAIRSFIIEMSIPVRTSSPASDATIGLTIAGLMFCVWIGIHIWAMFFLTIRQSDWPLVVVAIAMQCWLSVGMFIVAHDAMHGSLAPGRRRTNAAIGKIVLFLYAGFGWRKMRDAHFDHHRHAGSAEDPDFNAEDSRSFWPWYVLFLKRYFGWQSVAFVSTIVVGYYFTLRVPLENILLLYAIPAIASSLQLFYFGTYLPHRHDDTGFPDQHNARTNELGIVASLLSCFHFGYHHEHHLSPGTPWWALPQAHRHYRRNYKRDVNE